MHPRFFDSMTWMNGPFGVLTWYYNALYCGVDARNLA